MSSNRKQKLKKRKQKEQRRAARQKEAYERLAKIYRQVLTALRLDSLYRDLPAYDRSCIETTRVTALRILTAHQKSNWMPSASESFKGFMRDQGNRSLFRYSQETVRVHLHVKCA